MTALAVKLQAAKQSPAWQLVLDKFPLVGGHSPKLPEKKLNALKPLTEDNRVSVHWQTAIRSKTKWLDALKTQHGNCLLDVTLENTSRLLLHLGRASVLENVGLHADRTTGLPVIPGSAVKGVLSTWACWAEHFNETDESFREFTKDSTQRKAFTAAESKLATRIFGDNSADGSSGAGEIVFLGACPTKPPRLELDIVTPHHSAAGQDQAPVPNPFLTLAAGTPWRFTFLAKPRNGSDGKELLQQVETWLKEALEQSGLGAKTAAGYGRFRLKKSQVQPQGETVPTQPTAPTPAPEQTGDYPNEASFKNAVLDRLHKPGEYQLLQREVQKLESNPDNAPWIENLTESLRGSSMKKVRKRLKDKDWFPNDWLPK